MISLIIADDHPLYLEGLEMLVEKQKLFSLAAKCTSGSAVLEVLKQKQCDILMLDLHMPDMGGVEIVEAVRKLYPEQKIIMLTHQKGSRFLAKLEKLGINGYLLKNISTEEFFLAIQTVHDGKNYFSEGIINHTREEDLYIKSSVIPGDDSPETLLTPREKEVLIRVCNEKSSAEIAKELFISVATVDTHRKNILQKISTTSTVGLVKYALKYGLLNREG